MDQTLSPVIVRGDLIDGKFQTPLDPNFEWISRSPADLQDELGRFSSSYRSVDQAVEAARKSFKAWRKVSVRERKQALEHFAEALRRRSEELVGLLAREVGMPFWEAQQEVAAMADLVGVLSDAGLRQVQEYEVHEPDSARGRCYFRPLGVLAVIGGFSSPGLLPLRQIIPAVMTGNCVIFKPSEKVPAIGNFIAECFLDILPPGVFNLIQGDRETGRRLSVHEDVDGVLFSGAYDVGTRIKQDTLQQYWKLLVLETGGKNTSIVWEDADIDWAVRENLFGAFQGAGQRFTAASRILIHAKIFDQFVQRFHDRAKAFRIGHPCDNPFMGPMIDQSSVDRYIKFLGIASREGCEVTMRGKTLDVGKSGYYVTPSICWVKDTSLKTAKKSVYQQTEIMAPNAAVLKIEDLDEAVSLANTSQYGLATSVYSRSRELFEKARDDLQYGLIHWNRSTHRVSNRLPVTGLKKSGNHFSTGAFAMRYCESAISSVEGAEPVMGFEVPGLNWE